MKGVGIFALVFVVCVLAGIVVVPLLFEAGAGRLEEFTRSTGEEMLRAGKYADEFAKTHTQAECVPAALEQVKDCDSVFCQPVGMIFTSRCLAKAARSPELCREVPDFAISRWLWPRRRCSELGLDTDACRVVYSALLDYCPTSRGPRRG